VDRVAKIKLTPKINSWARKALLHRANVQRMALAHRKARRP